MRAGCWRFLHANDDKVTACGFRNDVRSRNLAFRPTVWLFREFSVRIINMNGHLCMIDFCSQPEPIFIPFKQLLPHRFPFTRSELAWPVILTHLKSSSYIGFCRQKSPCPRVHCGRVHRGENRRRLHNDDRQEGGRAEKDLCERVHPKSLSLSSFEHFNFHHRMNFPSCRAPRLMKSVSAPPLNRWTYLCAAVVFVVP